MIRRVPCPDLLACMEEFVNRNKRTLPKPQRGGTHGLKYRVPEQKAGRCRPGTKSWEDHQDLIRGLVDKLFAYVQEFAKRCGDPPAEILDWATNPDVLPTDDDWEGDWNAPTPPECGKQVRVPNLNRVRVPQPAPIPTQPVQQPAPNPNTAPSSAGPPTQPRQTSGGGFSIDPEAAAKAAGAIAAVGLVIVAVAAAPAVAVASAAVLIVVGISSKENDPPSRGGMI
jgi:hypothetical protein